MSKTRKVIVWGTVLSGLAAAYLMYRRGEKPLTIARRVTLHPVRTLVSEIRQA